MERRGLVALPTSIEIFRDMEKSHRPLVRAVKGLDRSYKADTKDPEP